MGIDSRNMGSFVFENVCYSGIFIAQQSWVTYNIVSEKVCHSRFSNLLHMGWKSIGNS